MSKEQIMEGSDNEFNLAFGQQSADMGLETSILNPESISAQLPPLAFVARAEYTRDGHDLIMTVSDGSGEKSVVIKNYFAGVTPPSLQTTDGVVISPQMVAAFMQNNGDEYYAQGILKQLLDGTRVEHTDGMVATVENIDGNALVIRNGRAIALKEHDMLMKGDVISTADGEKLEIVFADGTNFQLGGESRVSIDEFSFDEATSTGTQVLSILHGDFSYSSGLIAKDDPSSVTLLTPMGEIGIRGTKVVGDINADSATASITILEGRAIYQNLAGRQFELDQGFDTLRISNGGDNVRETALSPERVARDYDVLDSIEAISAFMLRPDQSEITDLSAVEVNRPNFDSITIGDATDTSVEQRDNNVDFSEITGAVDYAALVDYLPGIGRLLGGEVDVRELDNLYSSRLDGSLEQNDDSYASLFGGIYGDLRESGFIITDGRINDRYEIDFEAVAGSVLILEQDNGIAFDFTNVEGGLSYALYAINLDYRGYGDLHITENGIDMKFDSNLVSTPVGYAGSSSSSDDLLTDDFLLVFSSVDTGKTYRVILEDFLYIETDGLLSNHHGFSIGNSDYDITQVNNDHTLARFDHSEMLEALEGYTLAQQQVENIAEISNVINGIG